MILKDIFKLTTEKVSDIFSGLKNITFEERKFPEVNPNKKLY